ncbi:cephalosporin hydroxylase [Bradyrhizobium diazoefficiens]|jgi:cephalosporin hydroxylase|uniref:Cephalosporin hydroxylase n=1 Tax=Bradyrhizobium diazoefficiens TaxID=1355477 RepID=A0A809Y3E3_9BRAD|nr:cephalosporin hydroxylase family protein [Bradyrhizobium diazoefficiens]MDA9536064.1 cephalosporin hydroxylase [Bradyrhizobium sp. CCBAU 21362]BBZ96757.1 cephalosporin hydroxylase [Bradyrhizobium diazoefficiens]BCA05840.1 cephalosporin hydroxylase [Bradyrhizobium diazoefficiens]BCA14442.1 cephalosporin hydroxylase [Bradyrhizobium diazoefficiens]BCA23193.1 cephalosporin hydroxylase [Bradyrhizobium diazoefficiens]
MSEYEKFRRECATEIAQMGDDGELALATRAWMDRANRAKYSYHFEWMGRPIIQYPQDILAVQEIIWSVKPDLIIETGIAHGGSLIFSASMLELNAISGGPKDAEVLGIDIDIRAHNRAAVEAHPMARRISMIEGSSVAPEVIAAVRAKAAGKRSVLVMLDSNHTYDHVIAELDAFAHLATIGSYCIVFDTVIEDMPADAFADRPWGRGNNAKTAVFEFLERHPEFEIDKSIQHKLLVTVAPDGYLKRVS